MGGGGFMQDAANKVRELSQRRSQKGGFNGRSSSSGKLEIQSNKDRHPGMSEEEFNRFKSELQREKREKWVKISATLVSIAVVLGISLYLLLHLVV